jgi:hypothetical protein
MHLRDSFHHSWQVALQVDSQGQKVRNYQNLPDAAARQACNGFVQAGLRL